MEYSFFQETNPLQQIKSSLKSARTGSETFYQAMDQLTQLVMSGNVEAKLLMARVLLQKGAMKNGSHLAMKLFAQVKDENAHPEAIEGMADLMMWGVGVEQNYAESFKLYGDLAEMGYIPLSLLAYFYSHGVGTDEDQVVAADLILKSAAQGDTLAFILLAHRYTEGSGVPVDPLIAAAFAVLAEKRGFPGASLKLQDIHDKFENINAQQLDSLVNQLINNIMGLASDVEKLMADVPQNDPDFFNQYANLLAQSLDQLDIKALSVNAKVRGFKHQTKPHKQIIGKVHATSPLVETFENFADFEECQYLINQSLSTLKSTDEQLTLGRRAEIDSFTGSSAILSAMNSCPVSRVIQQRFADLVNTPVSHFEPLSVLKYEVGDEYSLHADGFDDDRIKNHVKKGDFGGQRMTTNLMYLLPADKGGETEYPSAGVTITGKTGMALIHSNATKDCKANKHSEHIGKPIISGEKWILRNAVRQHPLFGNNKIPLYRS